LLRYTSGAIYTGEWFEGKQQGRGTYEFPDGTLYEGEWNDHKMHGEGYYVDKDGNKWEGKVGLKRSNSLHSFFCKVQLLFREMV